MFQRWRYNALSTGLGGVLGARKVVTMILPPACSSRTFRVAGALVVLVLAHPVRLLLRLGQDDEVIAHAQRLALG